MLNIGYVVYVVYLVYLVYLVYVYVVVVYVGLSFMTFSWAGDLGWPLSGHITKGQPPYIYIYICILFSKMVASKNRLINIKINYE